MQIEKGLSLGYFQDIFLSVILSCTLCQPVVHHAANNYKTQLGHCVQCIPEPSQPVVYHMANNYKARLGCCVPCG